MEGCSSLRRVVKIMIFIRKLDFLCACKLDRKAEETQKVDNKALATIVVFFVPGMGKGRIKCPPLHQLNFDNLNTEEHVHVKALP